MNRRLQWLLTLACVLVAGALFWVLRPAGPGGEEAAGPVAPIDQATSATRSSPRPNVLLLAIDTLRGDHLHCAGLDWLRTPAIDALARDGVRFASCMATAPWTGPSFASVFTGLRPYRHGFHQRTPGGLPVDRTTLAEILYDAGYATGAYVTISYLTAAFGMDQGFTTGRKFTDEGKGEASKYVTLHGEEFIRQQRGNPFFLLLHYYDVHAPYTPPAPFDELYYDADPRAPGESLQEFLASDANALLKDMPEIYTWLEGITDHGYPVRQYAAGVSHVDAHVGRIVQHLRDLDLYDSTLIILVADHGEHLGEHDIYYAHSLPYHECLHVPLIIKWPGNRHAGMVVDEWISTLDILPTTLEALGLTVPPDLDGRGLTALVRDSGGGGPGREDGGAPGRPGAGGSLLVAEQGSEPDSYSKALVEWPWKLLLFFADGEFSSELYHISEDPGELRDVSDENPEVVTRLEERIWQLFDRDHPLSIDGVDAAAQRAPEVELSDEELQRLRALGYVD